MPATNRDFAYVPGDLDPTGPQIAWDMMDKHDWCEAIKFFEEWIDEYEESNYMTQQEFRNVLGAAACDLGACYVSSQMQGGMNTAIHSYLKSVKYSRDRKVAADTLRSICSLLDRVLFNKNTIGWFIGDDLKYLWAGDCQKGWAYLKREQYEDASNFYRLSLDANPNGLPIKHGMALAQYGRFHRAANRFPGSVQWDSLVLEDSNRQSMLGEILRSTLSILIEIHDQDQDFDFCTLAVPSHDLRKS